jgi:hypothetical protein
MTTTFEQRPTLGRIWRNGLLAALSAVVINLVLYAIGVALGAFPPEALTPAGQPVSAVPVIVATVVGSIAGIIGYSILTRFINRPRVDYIFIGLAVLVLIGMVFTPFGIQNVPVAQIVILEIMHLVVGGALIYWLTQR